MKMKNFRHLISGFLDKPRSLGYFYDLYNKEMKVSILTLSVLQFLGKYLKLIVMFLPIKIFLLLASDFSVPSLLSNYLDKTEYLYLMVLITATLYLINIIVQIYFSRQQNKESGVVDKHLSTEERNGNKKIVQRTLKPTYRLLADIITISFSLFIFMLMSPHYALIFSIVVVFYAIFIEYVAYTNNKFLFLDKLKVEAHQFIDISTSLVYLSLLFLLFLLYSINPMPIHNAILIMFASRLVMSSIRSYLVNGQKLVINLIKYKSGAVNND